MNILKNDHGSALLISMLLMLLLAGLGIMTIDRANDDMDLSYNTLHDEQAFHVAEAGARRAVTELNNDQFWRTGFTGDSLGDGMYIVVVRDSSDDATLVDTMIIQSTGIVSGGEAIVELYVTPPPPTNLFRQAMFAEDAIVMDRNTCTDSYNSDSGSYAGTYQDSYGNIGTNGTLTTASNVIIGGDIEVATPGGITLGEGSVVNGDSSSTADSVILDMVPQDEYDWAESISDATTGLSGSGYSYNPATKRLYVGTNGSVNLDAGTYFFSEIFLERDATVSLTSGATVDLYVTGNIDLHQRSTINEGGSPTDLIVYSQGDKLRFHQDNEFTGAFYGPGAHIQYDQTTEVYGALVGGTIKLDRHACFHYDRNLSTWGRAGTGDVTVVAWGDAYAF
jgi:hypothetical protein